MQVLEQSENKIDLSMMVRFENFPIEKSSGADQGVGHPDSNIVLRSRLGKFRFIAVDSLMTCGLMTEMSAGVQTLWAPVEIDPGAFLRDVQHARNGNRSYRRAIQEIRKRS
jgi:hypothetical protein